MFRILQESLTNISRHAQAQKVKITLKQEINNLVMSISDNGRGIDLNENFRAKAFGLMGMRQRAKYAGGSLEIKSYPNKGTTIMVTSPTRQETTDDKSAGS